MKQFFALRLSNQTIEKIKKEASKNKVGPSTMARHIIEGYYNRNWYQKLFKQSINQKPRTVKTKDVFKANGKSFKTFEDVELYAKTNGYRISNTIIQFYGTKRIHLIELKSN